MRFEKDGAPFWLAASTIRWSGLEDFRWRWLAPRDEMKLLLAHNPIILRRAARASVDLVLSGHTHGGQVAIRGERSTSRGARKRLFKGLGRQANTQIYVNRGLGTVCYPFRYGCPPEISLCWNCEATGALRKTQHPNNQPFCAFARLLTLECPPGSLLSQIS